MVIGARWRRTMAAETAGGGGRRQLGSTEDGGRRQQVAVGGRNPAQNRTIGEAEEAGQTEGARQSVAAAVAPTNGLGDGRSSGVDWGGVEWPAADAGREREGGEWGGHTGSG
uniref:Uncharacterized protein n=1 Tax=Opuntia streptacantha TaxID=393608 RepID=A0A7C9EN97_OPUST